MSLATPPAMRIPYSYLGRQYPPAFAAEIMADIARLVETGDFTLGYPVREIEGRVEAFTRLPHAVGAANGTEALILPLRALGIGHGDEVITAANTFVASAGAIAMTGATPVLVDVDDTYTIDPQAIARAITPRTRAILPVHLTGTLANMPAINAVAIEHNVTIVVEDAAQAMGATLHGEHAGSWGAAAGISFHPLKMMNVWGDGGMIVTTSAAMDRALRLLRNHGLETRDDAVVFGTNGRISSLQAVVANHGIQRLPWSIAKRREYAGILSAALADLAPRVKTPVHHAGVEPVYATYVIRSDARDALKAHLLDAGIDVKVHYPTPLHLQTVGRNLGYRPGDCPNAERQADEILTLPLHEYLTPDDLGYMAEQIHTFYRSR